MKDFLVELVVGSIYASIALVAIAIVFTLGVSAVSHIFEGANMTYQKIGLFFIFVFLSVGLFLIGRKVVE